MTREEHYRAALERIASQSHWLGALAAQELAAGGALPAEDTETWRDRYCEAENEATAWLEKYKAAEARLEQIAELLSEHVGRWAFAVDLSARHPVQRALSIARGEASDA